MCHFVNFLLLIIRGGLTVELPTPLIRIGIRARLGLNLRNVNKPLTGSTDSGCREIKPAVEN